MLRYLFALAAVAVFAASAAACDPGARRGPVRNLMRAEMRLATMPLRMGTAVATAPMRYVAGSTFRESSSYSYSSRTTTVCPPAVVPMPKPKEPEKKK